MLAALFGLGAACLPLLPPARQPLACSPHYTPPRAPPPSLLAGGTGCGPGGVRRKNPIKTVALNRKARQNYEILEEYDAGIALVGTEVKSCREGKITIRDGYVQVKDGEAWLENVNIAQHGTTALYFNHEEDRRRKLLLNKKEILKIGQMVLLQGLTVVPLSAYFNEYSTLKIKIGVARGKQNADKREIIRAREMDRDVRRQIKQVF